MAEVQVEPPAYKHVYPQQPAGYPRQPVGYPPPVGHTQQPVQYIQEGPPQGVPPGSDVAASVVIVQQPQVPVVYNITYRDVPVVCTCPNCRNRVTSQIHWQIGTFAWLLVLFLFLVGFGIGLCLIPLCLTGCKDAVHTCPVCNYELGIFRRM